MALEFAAAPVRDAIAVPDPETERLLLPRVWVDWFAALTLRTETNPQRLQTVELSQQSTSLGTTAIPLKVLTKGLYRLSYYVRITRAASTSSSVTVTLSWTDGSISCAFSTPTAITGNTTSTVRGDIILVRCDQASPITYATTYASVGATTMQYSLDIVVEQVSA